MSTLTVAELIEQRKQFPPDAEIDTEGCDRVGPADEATFDPAHGRVTIGDWWPVRGRIQ